MMFSVQRVAREEFVKRLTKGYTDTFGHMKSSYSEIISWAANTALEIIGNSDALYHNFEHTMLVTLVGQAILKGRHIQEGGVTCEVWLNCIISLLFHDVGYCRGICKADDKKKRIFATGKENGMVELKIGATDAALSPYHVDRGCLFIEERFGGHTIIDTGFVKRNIQLTKFPVPDTSDFDMNSEEYTFAKIVEAADLIGQLADPKYLQKSAKLFYEFEEIGANKKFGYKTPEDLIKKYPSFFWGMVHKHIYPSVKFLELTEEGNIYLSCLYSNVFRVEHEKMLTKGKDEEEE